jgi:ribosome-associated toxin RatA of RatAB toxin-antitoxin module
MSMEIRRTVLVPHSAERMFDLIEAAEHYPAFLPWCAEATIVQRDVDVVIANITVDYHGVRFHFTTRNPKRRPEWMAITLQRGPFRRFEGEWKLRGLGDEGSHIDFALRYDFDSGVMRTIAGPVFERITNTLVDAYVARADVVYAGLPPQVSAAPAQQAPDRASNSTQE